jgi:hypothetical protein
MSPRFCNRCGDGVEEGGDPRDELAELDSLLERLILKRHDLQRKINRLHSPIVRQLPPDVMSTIFEFCLPDFHVTNHIPSYIKGDFSIPLSLGAICSHWRDIAWLTPSLWSSLVVRVPSKQDSHMATSIVAKEWLDRSGQLPLSICIFSKSTISVLADIINQYSTRWSELHLCIPDSFYQCFYAIDNHAPILKTIQFQISSNELISVRKLNFHVTCPRLEKAYLSCVQMDGTNIQWDSLTHLTLHFMSTIDSFLLLRKTPRLVFCKVSGASLYHRWPGVGSIGPLVLTSLKSLQLLISASAVSFLNNIVAPHLEEFILPKYYHPSMEVITTFLRRSACSLRSLSVVFSSHFERVMNLLQSLPSLNTLSIISAMTYTLGDNDPRNLFQLVARVLFSQSTSLQEGFLPNLKILEFNGELYLRPGNYDDLYSLPPADNEVHGPLHLIKLHLHPATRIPKNMISYISSLAERGVTVNVFSDSKDILQSSIDYYRCREDSCRDWSDNLDSSFFT